MREQRSTFLNPLTDFGFKRLFGQEENKKYLISFLNALLDKDVVNIEYRDKEGVPERKDERGLIYDIYCTTASGKHFIVEMQNKYQDFFDDRALYYVSHYFVRQARRGSLWKYELTPVYGIFIMNFDWRLDSDRGSNEHLCEHVCLYNLTTGRVFSDRLHMYYIKLPLMDKSPEECHSDFDKWIYLLKNLENMETMPTVFEQYNIFNEFGESARLAYLSGEDMEAYERSLKVYRDNYAIAQTERRLGKEEGLAEGLAEGLKKGRQEGLAEGILQGKQEGLAQGILQGKLEAAINMLQGGLEPATVASYLGLPLEEIMAIRNSL